MVTQALEPSPRPRQSFFASVESARKVALYPESVSPAIAGGSSATRMSDSEP